MELQLFLKNNLAFHFYYHRDNYNKGKVKVKNLYLLIPGLPQFATKSFFQKVIKKDRAFFSVYYYGSWFSGNKFTFSNCQKTLKDFIKFVQEKKGLKTYDQKIMRWDYQNLFILGNSFAGNVILSSLINKKEIKKIILTSPLTYAFQKDIPAFVSQVRIKNMIRKHEQTLKFLRKGYPYVFRGINDSSWNQYFQGKEERSKIKINDNFPNIEIFHGREDESVDFVFSQAIRKQYSEKVTLKVIPQTGHDFERLFNFYLKQNGKNQV